MKKLQNILSGATTAISAILCAAMMIILFANVVLRLIPSVGGFSWYMECSQYLNVWAMLIAGIAISAEHSHLKVAIFDDLMHKAGPIPYKIQQGIVTLAIVAFYAVVAYSGFTYATRSNQVISTMPALKMSYIYWMFPVAGGISALSTIVNYIVFLTSKEDVIR